MFLEINQIRKSYGSGESRVEVLKGIDLSVEQGTAESISVTFFRCII